MTKEGRRRKRREGSNRIVANESVEVDIRFAREADRETDDEREKEYSHGDDGQTAPSAASTVSALVPV